MPTFPAGTVTFLFTDVERSTSLWERDAITARAVIDRHFAILRGAIERNGGVLFKTIGDATQSAFATAPQGVTAALAAQRGLSEERWAGAEARPRVRMALHAGVAEPQDGDYLAGSLNRLARLLDAAHGEQILLTHAVATLARGELPEGATLEPLGEYRLRDILQPEEIFQLRHPALRADFPPLNTARDLPHNLPVHPTAFLGREREVGEVETLLLRPGVRLVTLTGPGGVGKTRLAQQVAAEALESFPDGVYYVDLARQTDPGLVPAATAAALGLREQPARTLDETIADHLRDQRVLLVFDNFEHVLPAATLVATLLAAAPSLSVLVTSRARLDLQAEHEYPVRPLPVPDLRALPPLEELSHYDAVQLFLVRAQALRPGFALTEENAAAIAAICARLDGLPLALELAAARIKIMPPAALLARLERRLPLLSGGPRDLPERQRTLRDAINWSHDLLNPADRTLFRRLSVFVGGWTIEGAEAVGAIGTEAVDPLECLSSLVDQSLVDERPRTGTAAQDPRFAMLETIREFAADQLAASGEADATERAFEEFLIERAEAAAEGLGGPDQPHWLDRLEAEHDNLRAALGRVLERGDSGVALRLAPRLWRFWRLRGHPQEGHAWLERAIAIADAADLAGRADAEFGLGKLAIDLGNHAAADAHFRTCLTLRRRLGEPLAIAETASALAIVAINLRDYDEARALSEEALAICREQGDRRGMAVALHDLGVLAREQGDLERAISMLEESMAIWRALNEPFWIATVGQGLGITYRLRGDVEDAQTLLQESGALYQQLGDRYGVAVVAAERGHIARDRGEIDRAFALYGEALRHWDAIGASEAVVYCIEYLAIAAAPTDARLALRLFGAASAARTALSLPPLGESEARMVEWGLDVARRAAGVEAEPLLAAGRKLTLEQARDESLTLLAAPSQASGNADAGPTGHARR
jgi:predicted ATPase/class 3 adenylate cyclase